jgi:hypothetical protein
MDEDEKETNNIERRKDQDNQYHFSSQQYESASYIYHPHLCTDRMTALFFEVFPLSLGSLIQQVIAAFEYFRSLICYLHSASGG